jgi:hypothetical protein
MKARVIAMYLPQYHPIPENDETWGKGFTEWTNVAQARPLFKGHHQPRIPADLGFYDLRMPGIKEQQAKLALDAGIEGFMYWHYWFGNGKMLLEKPFQEVLQSGSPDFPFALGWANHSWSTKTWTKDKALQQNKMIAEQLYLGDEDYIKHFEYVLPAFKDKRYITVDGKPLFIIFDPMAFSDVSNFISLWNKLAVDNGLNGVHFVAYKYGRNASTSKLMSLGFNAVIALNTWNAEVKVMGNKIVKRLKTLLSLKAGVILQKFDLSKLSKHFYTDEEKEDNVYPVILPNYDRTARAGRKAIIYYNSTPEVFGDQIDRALDCVKTKPDDKKIVFLKSWNEWGEGNYVEPDQKYGRGYLDEIKKRVINN